MDAFGSLVVVLSWQMDRMTSQGATRTRRRACGRASSGLLLALLGGVLVLRSWRARAADRLGRGRRPTTPTTRRASSFALAAALFFVYALLLVGRGLPFWLGTTIFVTAFVFLFQHARRRAEDAGSRAAMRSLALVVRRR